VTGTCSFIFRLYDAAMAGTQKGPTLTYDGVGANPAAISVTGGIFTTPPLDFGNQFNGDERWLDIQVKCGADPSYSSLGTQKLTGAPYAISAVSLQGKPISQTAPSMNQVLQWNGSAWAPATMSAAASPSFLTFYASEPNFTTFTEVFNLVTNARNGVTTPPNLNASGNLVYSVTGCTLTDLKVQANANSTDTETFTVITTSGLTSTAYTATASTCTISSGQSMCSWSGSIAVPPDSRIGVLHTIQTSTPAGWLISGGVACR
jgi:hypothetical protein